MNIQEFQIPKEFNKQPLFMSLSGSHVYNTPNVNSDIDLRGCHVDFTEDILKIYLLKIDSPNPTVELSVDKYDIVSHEIHKFLSLMITKSNGNLYESLYSPVIIFKDEDFFYELKEVAEKALSKEIYWHYYGFAKHMLEHSYHSEERRYRKNVLYLFRNLLSGIHVLEKKSFILNFDELCEIYDFKPDFHFVTMAYQKQAKELFSQLLEAREQSSLKVKYDASDEMRANRLLLKIRRKYYDNKF